MKSINVIKFSDRATLPTRAHPDDAGLDLYASEDVSYEAGAAIIIPTDIGIEVPTGYVALIRDRSSMSKKRLKVTGGVVDAGYTGHVDVVMLNLSGEAGHITRGQKIAQVLLLPIATPDVVQVETLGESERGASGFGSSGV